MQLLRIWCYVMNNLSYIAQLIGVYLRHSESHRRSGQVGNGDEEPNVEIQREEVERLQERLGAAETRVQENRSEIADMHDQLRAVCEELEEAHRNNKQQQLELDALRRTHQQTVDLLETRSADLRDAQIYLTKTDSVSDAEVLALVEQLNSQIYQAAAQISDSINFDNIVHHTEPLLIESAKERIIPLMGEALVGLLGIVRHQDDTFCIQIALQASTVAFACKIIATWAFEQADGGQVSSNRVYTEIRRNESQGVSGRWRALTRLHTRALLHPGDVMKTHLLERLTQHIVDIFAVAGFLVQGSEVSCAFLRDNHADRLKTLIESCLRLRQIIGEEVMSGDFETLTVVPGERFDGDHATDGYADPKADNSSTTDHRVLCTTEMGLQRVVQTGGTDSERALHPTILLKPAVALETLGSELCQSSPVE